MFFGDVQLQVVLSDQDGVLAGHRVCRVYVLSREKKIICSPEKYVLVSVFTFVGWCGE